MGQPNHDKSDHIQTNFQKNNNRCRNPPTVNRLSFESQHYSLDQEITMKFVCLGYIEQNKFENMNEAQRNAMMDECFTYDDVLRKNGHFAGGEALQNARTAATLSWQSGKAIVTDGPYAETK